VPARPSCAGPRVWPDRAGTRDGTTHDLTAKNVIIAAGSVGKVPPIEGLAQAGYWTNVEATSTRVLPRSIVVLGAGPSGVEIAQYFARYDVRTTIVAPHQVNPTDHPRNSRLLAETLRRSGVDVRAGVRAQRVRPKAGPDGDHVVDLSDGSSVSAQVIQLSVGRTSQPALGSLGLETIGVAYEGADTLTVGDDLRRRDGRANRARRRRARRPQRDPARRVHRS